MIPAQVAVKSSTQDFIEIEDIQDDLIILKDGSCCLVIKVNAVNFGLLSEPEQEALIYSYAGLLNSLSFSIQLTIRSKRKDITAYLNLLKGAEEKQLYGPLREQIKKYRQFIETTVRVNNVLDKKFYIVIPFSLLEMGAVSAVGLFNRKKGLPYPKSYILERAKTTLYPKRDHLFRQLARLGLKAHQLTTPELIQLFYDIYNPGSQGMENIGAVSPSLTTPIIEGNDEVKQMLERGSQKPMSIPQVSNDQFETVKLADDKPINESLNPLTRKPVNPLTEPGHTDEPLLPIPSDVLIEEKK